MDTSRLGLVGGRPEFRSPLPCRAFKLGRIPQKNRRRPRCSRERRPFMLIFLPFPGRGYSLSFTSAMSRTSSGAASSSAAVRDTAVHTSCASHSMDEIL